MKFDSHLSDVELILAMDGELEGSRSAEVESHLFHCWKCRVRRAELEAAIGKYVQFDRPAFDLQIPDEAGPAARLRAQMENLTVGTSKPDPWGRLRKRFALPVLVSGAILSVPILTLIWLVGQPASAAGPLPDTRLTPGASRLISREQVCALSAEDEGRRIPVELAMRVFRQYKIENPKAKQYEVDYLISPSLGGAEDIRNLWPQPYEEGVWNSRVKDALEDHLRQRVCEGRIDLAAAQWEIAANWIAAYKKYFRTKRPIAAHTLFIKDSPWE